MVNEKNHTDFLVEVGDVAALDVTLRMLPGCMAAVVGMPKPVKVDGRFVVRVFGNPSFFLFAAKQQGYCRVIGEREE
jgi:hypothetical protein